ncbi:hypothetical protein LJB42_004429 [Komagataella kurtzmanii]|nr:hypothetical protein LJB42_004429 [Komagataella kurtzmanii]
MATKIDSKASAVGLLAAYDTFLFDCDGVLWLGDHLLPHVVETLELLRSLKKKVIFVTNNSTKSRRQYTAKFAKFGLNVTEEEIFGSAYASAVYLSTIVALPKERKVWVLGQSGIEDELHQLGYETLGGSDPELEREFNSESPLLNVDPTVGAVVAGLDIKVNYYRLAATLQYLRDPKVEFVATNIDSTYPQKGRVLPGAGSIVESAACASGRQPVACGKPSQGMMAAIKAVHQFDPSKAIMVGDRLNTDMKFGRDGGLATLLVLTGIETKEGLDSLAPNLKPTFYAEMLGDLFLHSK